MIYLCKLGVLEYALPTHWHQKFDLDGYVPTEHDRARLLRECEALERNEPGEMGKRIPKKKKGKKEKKPAPAIKKTAKGKYCTEHGWGTHSSSECWTLHPELMPEKFKTNKANKGKNKPEKESHAMLKAVMKEQLQELLTTMQSSRKRKVSFKTKKAAQKRKVVVDSDTDNSLHEMEETPELSDDKNSVVARVQAFITDEAKED